MGFTYLSAVILAALDCESNYHCTIVSDFFHKFCKKNDNHIIQEIIANETKK